MRTGHNRHPARHVLPRIFRGILRYVLVVDLLDGLRPNFQKIVDSTDSFLQTFVYVHYPNDIASFSHLRL